MSSLGSVYSTLPEKGDYSITGEVLFGLEYHSGQLLVHVVGARGLAAADKGGSSDPYVKTYLLPDKKKESKKKTKVIKKTVNPTFNETLKVGWCGRGEGVIASRSGVHVCAYVHMCAWYILVCTDGVQPTPFPFQICPCTVQSTQQWTGEENAVSKCVGRQLWAQQVPRSSQGTSI